MRNLRVRADENLPPFIPGEKTIHQRNKSSPALTSTHVTAGLKAPAKRSAFGDVSNTAHGARSTKDDGAMPLKQSVQVNDKAMPVMANKKTTFLKQASRPYSVSNLRGLLTGTNGTVNTDIPTKSVSIETNALANSRKTLIKRTATTVFKDVTLPVVQESAAKPSTDSQSIATSTSLTKPLPLPEVSFTAHATDATQLGPVPVSDASVDDAEKWSVQPSTASSEVGDSAALRSDGIYIDVKGSVQVYQKEQSEPVHDKQTALHASKPTHTSSTRAETHSSSGSVVLPVSYAFVASTISDGQPPPRAEPEEYWEEEEDENYDEEGYVTARSFRSRGENTTGGATTVLFPQVNQKIKKEIEAAKQLVEAERTPEEIEDECFDTSMVAEYGDEIFDYMRDLEVRKCRHCLLQDRMLTPSDRLRCFLIHIIWTIKQRSNGQCELSLWIGSSKSIIVSTCCLKHCSSPLTTSTDSCHARLFPLASCSWWGQLPSSSLPNMRKSTVLRCKRSSTW